MDESGGLFHGEQHGFYYKTNGDIADGQSDAGVYGSTFFTGGTLGNVSSN